MHFSNNWKKGKIINLLQTIKKKLDFLFVFPFSFSFQLSRFSSSLNPSPSEKQDLLQHLETHFYTSSSRNPQGHLMPGILGRSGGSGLSGRSGMSGRSLSQVAQ